MAPNSPPNADPRARFYALFQQHWTAGTGLDPKSPAQEWTARIFCDAMGKAGFPNLDNDTLAAWRSGERWPQPERKTAILNVFFPGKPATHPDRAEMEQAWQNGQRAIPPRRKSRIDEDPAPTKWVISPKTRIEGLADMQLQQPEPLNQDGHFRVDAAARLDIAEFEHEKQAYGIGVSTAFLSLESEAYQVKKGSMLGDRPTDMPIKRRADGVEILGPRDPDTGCIVGDLFGDEPVASIESLNNGEAPVALSLRAARRAFKVLGLDAQGRYRPERLDEQQDAVLNTMLGKGRETDSLGRVVLAKATRKRKTE